MSLFLPKGVFPAGVVDPSKLHAEFVRAARVAGQTGQWQWAAGAFGDADRALVKPDEVCTVRDSGAVEALLQHRDDVGAVPTRQRALLTSAGGADPNLWYVPYNQGFKEVGDGDIKVEWTSDYPELVWTIYTWQYIREDLDTIFSPGTNNYIRTAQRIQVDGVRKPGTGPAVTPINTNWRGTGLASRASGSTCVDLSFFPSGNHSVTAVAAQRSIYPSGVNDEDDEHNYEDDPPVEQVAIGHRRIICVCFALGGRLGS